MRYYFTAILITVFLFGRGDIVTHPLRLHPDVGTPLSQLLTKYGYPLEVHTVETEDGYLLDLHQIPYGKNSPQVEGVQRPVVLVMAGLWCDASAWIVMGPKDGLGYLLADKGYDVWMGNARGTTFGRKHVSLNPEKASFWNFSFHEMGYYDLPATIDYILNATKQEQLTFIGHSQGGTSFLVMASERPEYNDKIKVAVGLAPAASLEHSRNPMMHVGAKHLKKIEITLKLMGIHELLPHTDLIENLSNNMCNDDAATQETCASVFFLFAGPSPDQLNRTMIPVITTHIPAGASTKQIYHFLQIHNSGIFRQYDFGKRKNLKHYGTPEPPEYDLSKISTPIALFHASNDWMSDPVDILEAAKHLPYVIGIYGVEGFNHIDFMWAIDVVENVYSKVFDIIKDYK